jgi:hypothetical protein
MAVKHVATVQNSTGRASLAMKRLQPVATITVISMLASIIKVKVSKVFKVIMFFSSQVPQTTGAVSGSQCELKPKSSPCPPLPQSFYPPVGWDTM